MEAIFARPLDMKRQFIKLFSGLGTQGEEYKIRLKEDAKPHTLHTPENHYHSEVFFRKELDCMEKMGKSESAYLPHGLVVIPKKSGAARICVD